MNPYADRCLKCDQLLAALGEALLEVREVERALRQSGAPASAHLLEDYRSAEMACLRQRGRLTRHLGEHDRPLASFDVAAMEQVTT